MLLQLFIIIPLLALILDLIFQDPEHWPHPVRLIGGILDKCESWSRNQNYLSLQTCGIITLVISTILVGAVVYYLQNIWLLGFFISIYLAYAGISLGGLISTSRHIINLVQQDNLPEARTKLGELVTRDTSHMDREDIYKTLAESCSENLNDGFVAPFFFLLLGGPVLLWIYKTVSTMDSMWGYKNETWRELGWAGARADDFLAWVPARITAGLVIAGAFIMGLNWRNALDLTSTQAVEMQSPNAGYPMAAIALGLEGTMGGNAEYFGEEVFKPLLGPYNNEWTDFKIEQLQNLLVLCSFLWVLMGLSVMYIIYCIL